MIYWTLGTSLTACIAADRVLFLDIARDRYFAAPPAINDSFARWLLGDSNLAAPPEAKSFLDQICGHEGDEGPGPEPEPRDLAMPSGFDAALPRPRWVGVPTLASIARRLRRAHRDVNRRPLAEVLAERVGPERFLSSADPDLLAHRLAAFHSARPFVPVPRVCLHDCLALLDWLGEARAATQLVFGVAAYPFAAHSWVQSNGEVIDDHPEAVSRFTPIRHFP